MQERQGALSLPYPNPNPPNYVCVCLLGSVQERQRGGASTLHRHHLQPHDDRRVEKDHGQGGGRQTHLRGTTMPYHASYIILQKRNTMPYILHPTMLYIMPYITHHLIEGRGRQTHLRGTTMPYILHPTMPYVIPCHISHIILLKEGVVKLIFEVLPCHILHPTMPYIMPYITHHLIEGRGRQTHLRGTTMPYPTSYHAIYHAIYHTSSY